MVGMVADVGNANGTAVVADDYGHHDVHGDDDDDDDDDCDNAA